MMAAAWTRQSSATRVHVALPRPTSLVTHIRTDTPAERSTLISLGLLAIVCLAAALRIYHLGYESMWLDEAYSIDLAHRTLPHIILETGHDVHPPLYYDALHFWMRLFGDGPSTVRALSAICGILAIPVMFRMTAAIFDDATGLVAAALLALSVFHVEYAQEARMYALLAFLSLLSMTCFLRLVSSPSRWAFAGYVLFSALLAYTHAYSAFVIIAQVLYLAGVAIVAHDVWLRVWRRVLLAQAFVILLFLPWVPRMFVQLFHVEEGFWIPKSSPNSVIDAVVHYGGSAPLACGLGACVLLAIGVSVIKPDQRPSTRPPMTMWLLVCWLACPVLLPFALSQLSSPIFLTKYTIAALLAFIVLAARGLMLLPGRIVRIAAVVVVVAYASIALRDYYAVERKEGWRAITAGVTDAAQPNDLVLFDQIYGQMPFDYYSPRADLVEVRFLDHANLLTDPTVLAMLTLATRGHDRVWVVVSNRDRITPLVLGALSRAYTEQSHTTMRNVESYLFTRPVSLSTVARSRN